MGMKIYSNMLWAKHKIVEAFRNEQGDTNVISIVIILCIVVALALMFKDKVTALVTSFWDKTENDASSILQG